MAILAWHGVSDLVATLAFLDVEALFVMIVEGILSWVKATGRRAMVWFAFVGPVVYVAARWFTSRMRAGTKADAASPGITREDADSWAASLPISEPNDRE